MLAANDAAMNGLPDPEHALRELVGAGNPPAGVPASAPDPEWRCGPPCAAPPLPPAAPFVPVAGPPVVAPHVPGPAAPAVGVNPDILQHGQAVSRTGSLRYLQTIVKDHIFTRIKSPDPDEDLLSFSNDPRSICRQMATLLAGVADVHIKAWWNLTRRGVFETIKQLINNVIRLLGNAIKGNCVVSWCCCSLRLHTVFSNTNFPSPSQQNMYWQMHLVMTTI